MKNCCHIDRSSHQRCSIRKGIFRNFAKFTGKHLCQSIFFNKVAGLRPATLLKKRLWHRCFPANFAKFLRTPFLQNTSLFSYSSVSSIKFLFSRFICVATIFMGAIKFTSWVNAHFLSHESFHTFR